MSQDYLEGLIEKSSNRARAITQQAARGDISTGQWESQMRTLIKDSHNAAAMLGRDGDRVNVIERLSLWNRRRQTIQGEYQYLRRYRRQLESGQYNDTPGMLGWLENRSAMYTNKIRSTYWETRATVEEKRGNTEKRRTLTPAEHCDDCIELDALGWVPISDPLPVPGDGSTRCKSNDRCIMEFR